MPPGSGQVEQRRPGQRRDRHLRPGDDLSPHCRLRLRTRHLSRRLWLIVSRTVLGTWRLDGATTSLCKAVRFLFDTLFSQDVTDRRPDAIGQALIVLYGKRTDQRPGWLAALRLEPVGRLILPRGWQRPAARR